MAIADTKVPLFKDHSLDQKKISKKNHETGQGPTTEHCFFLDYS